MHLALSFFRVVHPGSLFSFSYFFFFHGSDIFVTYRNKLLVSEIVFFVLSTRLSFKDNALSGGFGISIRFYYLDDSNALAEYGSRVVFSAL